MKIYLDASCVNRLTDEQSQPRIRLEAEAIERILTTVREGKYDWFSSDVLIEEIENSPQIERRHENRSLLVLSFRFGIHIMLGGSIEMIAIENMTDAEFNSVAFDLLAREPGADGLARFLRLHRSGHGDYTAERGKWQQGLSVDDIVESIRRRHEKAV